MERSEWRYTNIIILNFFNYNLLSSNIIKSKISNFLIG